MKDLENIKIGEACESKDFSKKGDGERLNFPTRMQCIEINDSSINDHKTFCCLLVEHNLHVCV